MNFLIALLFAAQPNAVTLNDRCVDAYVHGKYSEAERLCRESIGARVEQGLPTAIARVNLAQALAAQGRRAEGRDEAQQAVAILSASPGPRDVHTLAAVNLLAALDLTLGDIDAAAGLISPAIAIERELDPAAPLLARSLHVLASVRVRQHRVGEALPLADESLRIAIRTSGDESADAALAYATAAEVHLAAGRPGRALPLLRRARAIYETRFSADDLRIVPILTEEAVIQIGDNQPTLARRHLHRARAILDHTCPTCAIERAGIESAMALLGARTTPTAALH